MMYMPDTPLNQVSTFSGLGVGHDADAAAAWLRARGSRSVNTTKTYALCSERLLLWCELHGLTFAQLTVADAQAHLDTLRTPDAQWLIPRNPQGKLQAPTSPYQTLKAPMTEKGISFTRTVLGQLFQYLLVAGYVRRNVFVLTASPAVVSLDLADKVLSHATMRQLWRWLDAQIPESELQAKEQARNRWLCALLYHTGIRTIEAISTTMGDFVRDGEGGWQLRVVGKGAKTRRVTVTSVLCQELIQFRQAMGLSAWPAPDEEMALVPHLNSAQSVSDRMIRKIVAAIGQGAASNCTDPHMAQELRAVSPHWFRHTSATHRQAAGAKLETTQQELGHADPRTTMIYAKISAKARRADAELFAQSTQNRTFIE